MKFLVSYYNHKPENKPRLAKYFEAQRLNMQRLGYGDDLIIISNEEIPGVEPYKDAPLSEYKYRYFNKYIALKQALSLGEPVLMMDHDLFIARQLKLLDDLHTPAIFSSSVVNGSFSEQMALFTSGTYEHVVKHIDTLISGNCPPRIDPVTVARHDNCYSSEGTQHNKTFHDIPRNRFFSCYDTLISSPEDGFNNKSAKTFLEFMEDPKYQFNDGLHVHISAYSDELLQTSANV